MTKTRRNGSGKHGRIGDLHQPTVLFVVLARGLGGSTRSLLTVLGQLEHRTRRIYGGPPNSGLASLIRERGLTEGEMLLWRPRRRALDRLSRPVAAAQLATWIWRNRRNLTAIHANGPEEFNIVVPGAWFAGVPVVVWSHARGASPWMLRLAPLWRWLMRRHTVQWAAVSSYAADVLARGGLADRKAIRIIPNPIDPRDIRAPSGQSSDRVVIGYLGSDASYKGFQLLPDVICELRDLAVRWIVFSAPRSHESKHAWERLGRFPSDIVEIAGKDPDVRKAFAQCDIVFCPSLEESFGRVVAEAMLNGIPVVASDLEPVRDLLGDDEAGLLFPRGDTRQAADQLRRLILDPARRESLGSVGRARAASFLPEEVVRQLSELYDSGAFEDQSFFDSAGWRRR
jgi:glycosyltransferase involved in cell wall biosynthesis